MLTLLYILHVAQLHSFLLIVGQASQKVGYPCNRVWGPNFIHSTASVAMNVLLR